MLLSFDNWFQARRLIPEVQKSFADAGLIFSVKKSQVMGMQATLEAGRAMSWEATDFLWQIPWVQTTTYLRKPLTHFGVGESTTTVLLPGLKQRAFQAFRQLKSVVKGMRWENPKLSVRLLNRYVGGTFFWYTPLFFPSQTLLAEVLTVQITMLCSLMHLFLPPDMPHEVALLLHQLRRRCVLLILGFLPDLGWPAIWRRRLWNCLGHVLRRGETSSVRRSLYMLDSVRRPRGGIITSPVTWLRQAVRSQYSETSFGRGTLDDFTALAQDRDMWYAKGCAYVSLQVLAEKHSYLKSCGYSNWRQFIRQWVPWNMSVMLVLLDGVWVLSWLVEREGIQQLSLGCDFTPDLLVHCVLHFRMLHDFLSFQLGVTQDHYDIHAMCLQSVHDGLFESRQIVLSLQIVPDSWPLRMRRLLIK